MEKKLYRSDENKIFLGICGGIGEYLKVDPVIIRIILVVLCCVGFSGVIAYIIAAFIIPQKPEGQTLNDEKKQEKEAKEESTIFEDYSSKYSTDNYNDKE